MRYLFWLLIFVPISILLATTKLLPPTWIFVTSGLAILPLAGLISKATEEMAKHLGGAAGGLLNATFGNATELIITLLAVRAGQLDIVQSSIIGSIIGNILLVLGLSIFVGGLKRKQLKFSESAASTQAVMLILAVVTLMVPSLFVHALPGAAEAASRPRVAGFSLWVAGLLITLYIGNLIFSLVTHREVFADEDPGARDAEPPTWTKTVALSVLASLTVVVAIESELLVGAIEPTIKAWGLSKLFVGVIIIPIIGNAAENATAITMAVKDRMGVTLNICVSSSTQIALFVAPLVVFLSVPLHHTLLFVFNDFELIAVGFAAWIAALIARDGDCNWFEGAQLLILYAILALAFYFVPP